MSKYGYEVGTNEHNDYLTRKLAHYNEWLLDPKRKPGVPYEGFPEDVAKAQAVAKLKAEARVKADAKDAAKAKAPAKVKAPKAKRARKAEGPTKLERAVELYKANMKLSKDNMIDLFRTELDMSLAGATTYYYNARKAA